LILIPGDLSSARYDGSGTIGYNARNDEIRDNVTRMRRVAVLRLIITIST
jgi:hypothetical protein